MKTRLTCTNRSGGLAIVILLLMGSGGYEEMRMKRSEHMRREGRVRVEGGGGGLKKTRLTCTNRIGGLAIVILLLHGSLTASRPPNRAQHGIREFWGRSRVLDDA